MRWLATVMIISLCSVPVPAAHDVVFIDTTPHRKTDYYPWITFLSCGPPQRFDNSSAPQARRLSYRVAVLEDAAETLVFLEEMISGEDGCCRSILSIRRLDLAEICSRFGLSGRPEGFVFLRWRSPTRFAFELRDRRFVLEGLGGEQVRVRAQK